MTDTKKTIFKETKVNHISMFVLTGILSVAVALPAQEELTQGSKAPDSEDFSDLLRGKVSVGGSEVKDPLRPNVEPSGEALEVDRVLAEARMKLRLIVEESATGADEVRNVFDETLKFITLRLQDLKEKNAGEDAAAKEQEAKEAAVPVVQKVADSTSRPPRVEVPAVPDISVEKPSAAGKVAEPQTNFLLRLAGRLRAIADELEASSRDLVED